MRGLTLADPAMVASAAGADPWETIGFAHWSRANMITGLAHGAAVPSWPAITGSTPVQASAANRPTLNLTGEARPYVTFDGLAHYLGTDITDIPAGTPVSLCAIVRQPSATGATRMILAGLAGGVTRGLRVTAGNLWSVISTSGLNGSAATANEWVFMAGKVAGPDSWLMVTDDADVVGTTGASVLGMTELWLGSANAGASSFFRGDIQRWGVYAGDISAHAGWSALKVWTDNVARSMNAS